MAFEGDGRPVFEALLQKIARVSVRMFVAAVVAEAETEAEFRTSEAAAAPELNIGTAVLSASSRSVVEHWTGRMLVLAVKGWAGCMRLVLESAQDPGQGSEHAVELEHRVHHRAISRLLVADPQQHRCLASTTQSSGRLAESHLVAEMSYGESWKTAKSPLKGFSESSSRVAVGCSTLSLKPVVMEK